MNIQTSEFVNYLDRACQANSMKDICENVRSVLINSIGQNPDFLPDDFLRPAPGKYARRLFHKCPKGIYSVVIMVWDSGQGTGLHDHSGSWCVEGVYRGKIQVESFEMIGDERNGRYNFEYRTSVEQGTGKAGVLIPPFEYHILSNPFEEAAVTIHVYSGEMTQSSAFYPVEGGGYRREVKALGYTA